MNLIDTFFPDHFSQTDRLGVLAGVLFSIVASIALVKARPPSVDRVKTPVARLETYSNSVRYKESGSVSFYDVSSTEELQNKDEIFTGEDSHATVRFLKSETVLKIPSSSLIRIEESDHGDSIEVQEGLVDIVVKKHKMINLKSNGVTHQINSSQNDSVIKAFNSSGELHLFTTDKGVKIKSGNSEIELPSNQDAKLIGSELKNNQSFSLISPTPGEKLESSGAIKIKTNQKDKYNVTISKNVDFSSPFYSTKFEGTNLNWELLFEEGDYFLKIENKNDRQIIPVSLTSKYRVEGLAPSNGALLNLTPGKKTTFSWNPLPVKSYKVIIRDNLEKERTYITHTNRLVLENLKGSEVKWSVLPEISPGKFSNLKKIALAEIRFDGKIEFSVLPKKTVFYTTEEKINIGIKNQAGEQVLVKVWDLKNEIEIFTKKSVESNIKIPLESRGLRKVEIFSLDYPGKQKAEFTYEVKTPFLTWDTKLQSEFRSTEDSIEIPLRFKDHFNLAENSILLIKHSPLHNIPIEKKMALKGVNSFTLAGFGTYCLSALINSPPAFIANSSEYCLKFIQTPVFSALPKAKDAVLSYAKHNSMDAYKIEVPHIEKAVKYQLEIYSDKFSKDLVYTVNSYKPEIFWTTNRSGIYYLKYKVFDAKNRKSDYSPFSKLIFPISPLSDW